MNGNLASANKAMANLILALLAVCLLAMTERSDRQDTHKHQAAKSVQVHATSPAADRR